MLIVTELRDRTKGIERPFGNFRRASLTSKVRKRRLDEIGKMMANPIFGKGVRARRKS